MEHSHRQLIKDLEATHMKKQATRVEVSSLRLHSARMQKTVEDLIVQRSEEALAQQAQKETWAKEWEDVFWASPEVCNKFIDRGFIFLQWRWTILLLVKPLLF